MSSKREIYQAMARGVPGYWYFADTRSVVPRQVIKQKDGTRIANPEFDPNNYTIVERPVGRRPTVKRTLDDGVTKITRKISLKDVGDCAEKHGLTISFPARKIIMDSSKDLADLESRLSQMKLDYPNDKYVTYSKTKNSIVVDNKAFRRGRAKAEEAVEDEEVNGEEQQEEVAQ